MPNLKHFTRTLFTLTGLCLLASCGLLAQFSDDPFGHKIEMKAQYVDANGKSKLEGHSVAVIVAVPEYVADPDAANDLGKAITQRISEHVKGVKMIPYSRVQAFVEANPYWGLRPISTIQAALDVDRLVVIDIREFRLHEEGAGNELLQGICSGSVRVVEKEDLDPNRYVFSQDSTAQYPSKRRSSEGLPNSHGNLTPAQVRYNLIQIFSFYAGGTFYDHKEER